MEKDRDEARWRARPVAAAILRVLIVSIPLVAGYGATTACLHLLKSQIAATRWWLLLAAATSVLVCVGVERLTRRLLPLAALLKLSMLFPDRAPSRFKIARQALSVARLKDKLGTATAIDAGSVAEGALALITALTAHDRRTRGHCERVRLFADLLGDQMRLPQEARDKLRWAALLHDIGKLQVAAEILNKPTKLSSTEWDLIAAHPATGEQLLTPLLAWLGEWGGAVREHHEKYDGTGYPDGVAGAEICRAARIVSIADAYEVMTASRAYKKPMATLTARSELARCSGAHFDPAYVRAFLEISLPRLLWAMGPASLLMNLPLLRAVADTANKGVLASSQTGVLAASAVVAIGGVSTSAMGPGAAHPTAHPQAGARPGHTVAQPAVVDPKAPAKAAPLVDHKPGPRRPSAPARVQPDPAGVTVPLPPAAPVAAPPVLPVVPPPTNIPIPQSLPTVAFTWVPFPRIALTKASVGFAADANAVRVHCALDDEDDAECTGDSVSYDGLDDGAHRITIWAEDATGSQGPKISTAFTVDTQAPTVAWTVTPPAQIATDRVTVEFTTTEESGTAWCALDDAAASECTSPATFTGLADGTHSIAVHTVDAVGNVGPAIQTVFAVDTTAPVLTLTSAPAATIKSASATIDFTTDDAAADTTCALDGAPATACTSPVTFTGLADGPHTVTLSATDDVGNRARNVTVRFTVDTTGPSVTLTSPPAGTVPSRSVSVAFSTNDPTATAWCSLDDALATPCVSPVSFTDLIDGPHTVAVYAVDPVGNQGPAVTTSFIVSTAAPTVTLGSVPAHVTNNPTATVAFIVDDPTATAYCSLDGAPATACTNPVIFTGLGDGEHTVAVYAVSLASAQSGTVSTTFTVDTRAPTVTVTSAPSGTVRAANAVMDYTVDDPTATVWCAVDTGPAAICTGPVDFASLPQGQHTVSLHAVDRAGNVGPIVQRTFTIDDVAPAVTVTSAPPATTANHTATVTFNVDDSHAVAWCSLDGHTAQQCTGGTVTYTGLAEGSHTISVYAVDIAGNRGTTASTTFTIAATAPVFLTTPPSWTHVKTVTFTWLGNPLLSYQFSYDGVHWKPTTTGISNTTTGMKNGSYTFHLRGVDSHGTPTAEATYTFRIVGIGLG